MIIKHILYAAFQIILIMSEFSFQNSSISDIQKMLFYKKKLRRKLSPS